MDKCRERPCELPRTKRRLRNVVVCCPWCRTLYYQKAISSFGDQFWIWGKLEIKPTED